MLDLSRVRCLGDALRDASTTFKSKLALIEADRHRENCRYTFAEARQLSEGFAALIQGRGFEAGDRCAILMQNQSKWLLSATGALWAGAVLVPLDYKLTAREQLDLLAHCQPRVLVTEASTWERLRTENRDRPEILERTLVIVTEPREGQGIGPALPWQTGAATDFEYVARDREDIACIVYSSGTSGTPKGCMLTHSNYLAQAEVLGRLFPMEENDRFFSVLPTNHAIDFMLGFLLAFMMGGGVVHQRTLRPKYLASTMQRYQITQIALVPTILKNLEKKLRERLDDLPRWQRLILDGMLDINEVATRRAPNHRLSSRLLRPLHEQFGGKLRYIFAGGAFVNRDTAEFFNRIGIPVVIGYGLTEASTVLTVNDLEPFRGDTVGKPIRDTEIEIREANEVGIGEVWARGPTIMRGYLDAPELTAEAIQNGWLQTGDLGTIDAAGHLKLVGRSKNMIVTEGGKNVYPENIEALLGDLEGCEEHAVFAANYIWPKTTMTGEQLILVIKAKKEVKADFASAAEEALQGLRKQNRRLADYKRISGYLLWDEEFPRTASRKLKRSAFAVAIRKRCDRTAIEGL